MPRYSYQARYGNGEVVSEVVESASLPALAAKLASVGATIQTAQEITEPPPRLGNIPYFEVVGIYRQIASALEAGLPVPETLEMLSNESRSASVKTLMHFLRTKVSQGMQLSEAMKLAPKIFPDVHVAAIRAGEESGRLERVMSELADQSEALSNMNRKIASSLVYPVVIAFFALLLFNGGMIGIIPKFMMLYDDLGIRELPVATKLMFLLASRVAPVMVFLILAVTILGWIILTQRRAASGRLWLDSWKLRIPLVGQIVEKAALARFSGTLGVLLEAGIDLPKAIRMAAEGAGNRTVEYLLKSVSSDVELGSTLSEALGTTDTLPPTLAWRVGVGEETGSLPGAMNRMSKLYSDQVQNTAGSVAAIIEPLLIIFIGSGVMLLVVGMLMPLVAIIQSLSGG